MYRADKNGRVANMLYAIGLGFVEIGTVTPEPQAGNPKPRVFRALDQQALVNRLGFPSVGAEAVARNLSRVRLSQAPLGINIGKNASTPLDQAASDYLRCLEALTEIGFDGYAIGGLSVGEKNDEMVSLLNQSAHRLPEDHPRYLMGVGTPADIVNAVAGGVDQFDCVLPTRNGRKGYAYTSTGVVRLRNAVHRRCEQPLDRDCDCYCCRRFTRAYLRHLITSREQLGGTLVSLHNIRFYQTLMSRIRDASSAGELEQWRSTFMNHVQRDTNEESPE